MYQSRSDATIRSSKLPFYSTFRALFWNLTVEMLYGIYKFLLKRNDSVQELDNETFSPFIRKSMIETLLTKEIGKVVCKGRIKQNEEGSLQFSLPYSSYKKFSILKVTSLVRGILNAFYDYLSDTNIEDLSEEEKEERLMVCNYFISIVLDKSDPERIHIIQKYKFKDNELNRIDKSHDFIIENIRRTLFEYEEVKYQFAKLPSLAIFPVRDRIYENI